MSTPIRNDKVVSAMEAVLHSNYYAEDFELVAELRAFSDNLSEEQCQQLYPTVYDRVSEDPNLVHIILATVLPAPGLAPVLVEVLRKEPQPNMKTRLLFQALSQFSTEECYTEVSTYLDSSQQLEALAALAKMDFVRTLPHIKRSLTQNHMLDICLHLLADRRREVGFDQLVEELQESVPLNALFVRRRMRQALRGKTGDHNPFDPAELDRLASVLR